MFERLEARARRGAERRALYQAGRLADAVRDEGVRGLDVRVEGESLMLSGRELKRRFALDPALRWLTARLR